MTVYVDDMKAGYGRMKMCHMIATDTNELHEMADRIGVDRKWHQAPPKHDSHYDIALSKRALAVAAGAVEITMKQCACMVRRLRETGEMGSPEDAITWRLNFSKNRRVNMANTSAQDTATTQHA
jgi:Protein of unknown function (DUF4031)